MGLFNEFKLKKEGQCSCGSKISIIQTKVFESFMDLYKVGDVIEQLSGTDRIVLEELYCNECHKTENYTFLTFAQGIYIGNYKSIKKANKKIKEFKKYKWVKEYHKTAEILKDIKEEVSEVKNLIRDYSEYKKEFLDKGLEINPEDKTRGNSLNVFRFGNVANKSTDEIITEIFEKLKDIK